ncbi:MAG: hypothetical protein IJE43_13725 [Alphaproteobacteria bacterium]|nr:hypothetical protein [Alphaproteobacteria bacterium]
MKKKTLALLVTVALVASMTACGGKTEETANTNVNEPVAESSVETQVAESTTQESQATESTEENPAGTESFYEVSAVIYPTGSEAESIDYDAFYNNGTYMNPELITPYYIITNTSDSAYAIKFELLRQINEDAYFEAGESMVVPAELYMDNNNIAKWCNVLESEELQYGNGIETSDANPTQNRVQEMMTITFDESKVLSEGVMSIDIELPASAVGDGGDLQYLPCYVIYYDENGNVISSGPNVGDAYNSWNLISYADKTFTYPALYYTTTNEPFVWATADVYYSYTLAE